jgi:RNA-dependent RNA polymerase
MAKYVSRFALGLSSSFPGLLVDQSNIKFIDDISKFRLRVTTTLN